MSVRTGFLFTVLVTMVSSTAHADPEMQAAEEQLLSVSAGPIVTIPIGDYAADNDTGGGFYLNGTAKIVGRLAFAARYAYSVLPNYNSAGFTQDVGVNTISAGVRFHIPVGPDVSPSPLRILFSGQLAKSYIKVARGGEAETDGLGAHISIGLSYRLLPNFSIEGTTGYTLADTSRGETPFLLEVLHFSLAGQAHF
jgi:hypothetical protein